MPFRQIKVANSGGACAGGAGCDSPDRMCKVTAVFDRKPTGISAKVILVDEDLGY